MAEVNNKGGAIEQWSIGIYKGNSPFNLMPINGINYPMISREDITDIKARFVADPFIIKKEELYYLFFEALNDESNQGEIGLSTSKDGIDWNYEEIVLKEPFHLSYPYLFKWEDKYYMIPETLSPRNVRLYKAKNFPFEWEHIADLLPGAHPDPTLIRHDNKWWLFTSNPSSESFMDTLRLYFADELIGPYTEHPMSPLVEGDNRSARPAGRMIKWNGKWIRFCQDCFPNYGSNVRAFEINELTTTTYSERELDESPILKMTNKENNWNGGGMHQIDPYQLSDGSWMACVDGHFTINERNGL